MRVPRLDGCPLTQGDPESLPVLLELLHARDGAPYTMLLIGLERIGPPARESVPYLLQQIRDPYFTNQCAWRALYSIDPEAARKVDTFGFHDYRPEFRGFPTLPKDGR